MTRFRRPVRFLALWAACFFAAGVGARHACADGLALTAVFGLAGHYRPGTWCPVTVTVHNPGLETLSGQAQVLAEGDPGRRASGGPGSNSALASALFTRPISVNGSGQQSFVVYTRGIDPAGDTVTVQLADRRERGDGRILAQTNNQPNNGTPTVTGIPIQENDLFLVGFGGDPGAFTYLSGQKLGLAHSSGGGIVSDSPGVNPRMSASGFNPATAQVASAGAADLPDKAAGYSGVDAVLLRSDAPLDTLTEAQADALKGWVASGGHLIVCGGVDATRFGSSFFTGLLPAGIGLVKPSVPIPGVGQVGALTLIPKPLPGVRTLAGSAQTGPLVVSGPYGTGCVTLTAYDPTTKPFQNPQFAVPALWQTLLTAGQALPSSVLSHVAAREENHTSGYGFGGEQPLLSDAVMRAPSLDAPGTEIIGLFLLVYLIVLVPVNYLILKRLDRKEMAWVTIPVLVVIFAVGTFGVGYAAKGGAVFVNRAAILETSAGQRQAGAYTELGLFSPHRTSYDITLPGANALAAIPNPGVNYRYGRRNSGAETQSNGQTRFVETVEGATLQDTAVNMWAMRAFDSQSTTDLGGTVDAVIRQNSGGITGTVTNHLPYGLTDCAVLYNSQWQALGDLTPGATAQVSLTAFASSPQQAGLQIPPLRGGIDKNDPQGDIRQRMRAALADYARSLGRQNNNGYYYNGSQMQPPGAYSPAPGEALLLGWSDDPALSGPAPRIDGHSVKENDVTLIVIHLPISGYQVATAAPPPPPVITTPRSWMRPFRPMIVMRPYSTAIRPGYPPTILPYYPPNYRPYSPLSPMARPYPLPPSVFGVISRNSSPYRQAIDPQNTLLARKSVGHAARFHAIVRHIVFDRTSGVLVLSSDPDRPLAMPFAVVNLQSLHHFHTLFPLQNREVVVSGPVTLNKEMPVIRVSQPAQIQIVQ